MKVKAYTVSLEVGQLSSKQELSLDFPTLAPSWASSIFVQYVYVIVWGNAWRRLSAFLGTVFVHNKSTSSVHSLNLKLSSCILFDVVIIYYIKRPLTRKIFISVNEAVP